ncbi:MAG: sulfatase [Haloarculaceae archaeon]
MSQTKSNNNCRISDTLMPGESVTRPNLLFVCIDCLRSDFVGTGHADTPFIDSLVERGTHYTNLYSTTTTTTPAVTSFMTGTYSERNGVFSLEEARLNEEVPTLAEHLSAAGYDTHALVTGPLVSDTGLSRGFDNYDYRDRREELVGDWYDQAEATVDSLSESEPFFLYLHLWEIHTPVEVPPEFDEPEYGDYPYARTFAAVDRRLERLCENLPDNTVVALHGDHGEAIAYRDSYVHKALKFLRTGLRYGLGIDTRAIERRLKRRFDRNPPIHDHFLEDAHGENVFDFTTNVPFVLTGPDIDATTVDSQVRQIDIMPTLLDAVGVERDALFVENGAVSDGGTPPGPIDGESLLPPENVTDRDAYMRACGKALVSEKNWQRAIRANGWKYIEYPNRDWDAELYDLDSDPSELNPVDNERIAGRMQRRLPEEGMRDGEKLEIDGLLKDLGYK